MPRLSFTAAIFLSAFETGDVQGEVDFEARTGEFVPNSGETAIELPIQQYLCYMDRFQGSWMMMKLI